MPLPLAFQGHHEEIVLDIVPMARHDVVLGTPWLEKHNPSIDWVQKVLRFERCRCVTDINPRSRQRSTLDEERQINEMDRQPTTKQHNASDSADTDTGRAGSRSESEGGSHAPPGIPREFTR